MVFIEKIRLTCLSFLMLNVSQLSAGSSANKRPIQKTEKRQEEEGAINKDFIAKLAKRVDQLRKDIRWEGNKDH